MINDSHLHVGQFYDHYTSPSELIELADRCGIDRFAVSSTTTCEENYKKVIEEHQTLERLAGARGYAVLWLTPLLLAREKLSHYLDCGVIWRCVKVHPQIHPYWSEEADNMEDAVEVAQALKVPLLIHTGTFPSCHPLLFEENIRRHPEQTYILAHSRPLNEVRALLKRYPNVYCDTAFTPIEDVVKLVEDDYESRVLWGSDLPIQRHFAKGIDMACYSREREELLRSSVSAIAYELITRRNFLSILGA